MAISPCVTFPLFTHVVLSATTGTRKKVPAPATKVKAKLADINHSQIPYVKYATDLSSKSRYSLSDFCWQVHLPPCACHKQAVAYQQMNPADFESSVLLAHFRLAVPYTAFRLQYLQLSKSYLLRVNKIYVKTAASILFAGHYSLTCEQKSGIFMVVFVCKCLWLTKKVVNPYLDKTCLSSWKHSNYGSASKVILPFRE